MHAQAPNHRSLPRIVQFGSRVDQRWAPWPNWGSAVRNSPGLCDIEQSTGSACQSTTPWSFHLGLSPDPKRRSRCSWSKCWKRLKLIRLANDKLRLIRREVEAVHAIRKWRIGKWTAIRPSKWRVSKPRKRASTDGIEWQWSWSQWIATSEPATVWRWWAFNGSASCPSFFISIASLTKYRELSREQRRAKKLKLAGTRKWSTRDQFESSQSIEYGKRKHSAEQCQIHQRCRF